MHQIFKTSVALALISGALLGCLRLANAQVAAPQNAAADKPFLHPLFTDNMVLQRDVLAPVWGWAKPGQKISVSLSKSTGGVVVSSATANATANANGQWMAKIGPVSAGGPYTLSIVGPQKITLKNVLFGDVWICSGQSNMEMGLGGINAPAEVAAANYPNLRLFTVPKTTALTPQQLTAGQWDVCTPETVQKGSWAGFSAVAYFFGKNLQQNLGVPIGLIHSSWGGTVAQAWVSSEALKVMPDFAAGVAQVEAQSKLPNGQDMAQLMRDWWQKNDPGTRAGWQNIALDTKSWKIAALPGGWENSGLPDFDGIVWFRKEIVVPDAWAGQDLTLRLGPIDDSDSTFFNGAPVGSTDGWQSLRAYKIPGNAVKAGRNFIAVRVLDSGGGGGFHGVPDELKLSGPNGAALPLAGEWSYQVSLPLAQASPVPVQIVDNPNTPTVLYNAMIAPLEPFAAKGAIWYQGESNAGNAKQYQTLLPTLINDWRGRFGGEFPFFIVQLANFMAASDQPTESGWAELREAQALTAQTLPKTGLAVAIDIGDAADIHPINKQEVGRRLALSARAIAYGQKIEYSGPIYRLMTIENGAIRLQFQHAAGIASRGGEKLRGFAIAGVDKKWNWAQASIEGGDVVLRSPAVPKPTAARYNWADNPNGNLTNAAGLPAVPFRTDAP